MKSIRRLVSLLLALMMMVLALTGCGQQVAKPEEGKEGQAEDDTYIAVISKGFQHEFWQTVKLGCDKAEEELGIKVTFEGPQDETMIDEQIAMVENAIAKQATGILLAALDSEALVPVIEKAKEAGIPVITFDSDVSSSTPLSFVATDNRVAGAIAAKELAKMLDNKGKVGVVAHNAGTSTAIERRDGFIEELEMNYPDIEIVGVQYSDGDHQKALEKATDMMSAHPDLAAIYATNEGAAMGVATAVREKDKAGEVKVIGFDSSEGEIEFLEEGVIQGFVVQNPFNMGYIGVKTLYDAINGEKVKERIDTGATFVSKENIETEEIQKLLYPLDN